PEARARAQELRHAYDAILVGAGTVMADDPSLTDRSGLPRRRALVRVVLDETISVSPNSQLAQTISDSPVIVFGNERAGRAAELRAKGVDIVNSRRGDLLGVLKELGSRALQRVLVEGGA